MSDKTPGQAAFEASYPKCSWDEISSKRSWENVAQAAIDASPRCLTDEQLDALRWLAETCGLGGKAQPLEAFLDANPPPEPEWEPSPELVAKYLDVYRKQDGISRPYLIQRIKELHAAGIDMTLRETP